MAKLTSARLRSRTHRWASLLAAEQEGAAWLQGNREHLRIALGRIYRDDLLALHWLRAILIHFF